MVNAQDTPVAPARATMPVLPPAVIDETLAVGGEEIDAKKLYSRMTVEVMINDQGPHRFIVDSGADTSVIGERIARDQSLASAGQVLLNSMTDSSLVERAEVEELQLGPTRFYDLELPVLKEVDIGAEGMIGLDALVEQRLMLDFDKRIITVDDARNPSPRLDGEIVVRARLERGQLILTEVEANGKKVDAVIDTGSEITIGNSRLREQLLRNHHDKVSTATITGVTGVEMEIEVVRVAEIRLGPVLLRNVVIAFADLPPFRTFGLDDQPAMLIGTDLMEQFRRVSLDFRQRRVRFQLKQCEPNVVRLRTDPFLASRLSADRASAC